jgi:hypothetical protein
MPDVAPPRLVQFVLLLACVGLCAAHFLWGPTRAVKVGVALLVAGIASGLAIY